MTADVAEQLGDDVLVLRGSLDRESLRLGVVRLKTAEQRLAWLADHLAEQPGSGIVYCLTVAATQEVAGYLRSRGHDVHAYSGQTDATERAALESSLAAGQVKALVATSALGMGFDATWASWSPRRAAVAGGLLPAGGPRRARHRRGTVVLLPATEDRDIWAYFASLAFPREQLVRQTLEVRAEEGRPMSTAALERGWSSRAPAWRPCSRCSTSTEPCAGSAAVDRHRRGVGLRRRPLRPGHGGARA